MPRAGFTAIHSGTIKFGKDGNWYCDDEPITNAAICRLYARSMTVGADGVARLELGEDRARVVIEDTPWVVRRVDGDPDQGFRLRLNDASEHPLDLSTLRIGPDDVLYCRIAARSEVRFLRPAYYQLMAHAVADPGGAAVLRSGAQTRALAPGD